MKLKTQDLRADVGSGPYLRRTEQSMGTRLPPSASLGRITK
jgi:hypothetical protein